MKTLLKWTLGSLAVILVLLTLLAAYILFGIDPNSYKPELEKLAADQGIDLKIEGDLAWQLFPELAIRIGRTSLASDQHNLPRSRIESADLSLDLLALLGRRIAVRGVHINGADIELKEAAQGASVAALPATSSQPATIPNSPFSLAVDDFSLTDSRILLPGEGGAIELGNLQLKGSKLNFDGNAFPLTLHSDIRLPGATEPLGVDFSGAINANLKGQSVRLDETRLTVTGLTASPLHLGFNGQYDLAADQARISGLEGSLGALAFKGDVAITGVSTAPAASGSLQVPAFNLKEYLKPLLTEPLKTRKPEALTRVGLQTSFSASAAAIALPDLAVSLDDSSIAINLQMALSGPRNLQLLVTGDKLDIDNYLAPPSADNAAAAESPADQNAALFLPLVAPLALLEGGIGTIDLAWKKLVIDAIPLSDPQLKLTGNSQEIKISKFSTGVFGGTVSATANLNLSQNKPVLKLQQKIAGIQLRAALAHLADNADMSGVLTMDLSATTRGDTIAALRANLKGNGVMHIEEPVLKSINIEQNYCELAALVEKPPARTEPWPKGTRLNAIDSRYQLAGNSLILEQFSTGLGNLLLSGNGVIDAEAETFDIRLTTNLQGDRTSETGCIVKSKRIRNKDLVMHCRDSFAKAGSTSCRPDEALVKSLLQDKVIDKIREKAGGDSGTADAVEGLLKGIFGGGKQE